MNKTAAAETLEALGKIIPDTNLNPAHAGDVQSAIAIAVTALREGGAPLPPHLASVLEEVDRATAKFPQWPTDPLHALAVLGEEFGELTKAVLQTTYEPHKVKAGELRSEAVQTAAMALRFLASLDRYEFTESTQHEQGDAAVEEG